MSEVVYQTDSRGVYIYSTEADESPLEPGVFLIPAGAYEDEPPRCQPHEQVRRENGAWVVESLLPNLKEKRLVDQAVAQWSETIQDCLDNVAFQHGYNNILSAISYAEEPAVAQYQLEGRAFRAWRFLVWHRFYSIIDEVKGGKRETLTLCDLLKELPEFKLPS